MPRPPRFTQEEVAVAAFDIVRGGGEESLTARSLAEKLGCSVKPIFGLFDTMDEVRQAVWEQANAWYIERLDAAMSAGDRPPYLASGLAYIEFARTEPNLFTLLFMHRRTPEQMEQSSIQLRPVIEIIARQLGVGVCAWHRLNDRHRLSRLGRGIRGTFPFRHVPCAERVHGNETGGVRWTPYEPST